MPNYRENTLTRVKIHPVETDSSNFFYLKIFFLSLHWGCLDLILLIWYMFYAVSDYFKYLQKINGIKNLFSKVVKTLKEFFAPTMPFNYSFA